jgi:hypothetical protein
MSTSKCTRCHAESKLRHRQFSDQVLSALIIWGELQAKTVDKPMCDSCYDDLRETLIDRAEEMNAPVKKKPGKKRKKAVQRAV